MHLPQNFLNNTDFQQMYKLNDIDNWLKKANDFTEGVKIFDYFSKINFDKKFPTHMPERMRLANLRYELNKIFNVQKTLKINESIKEILLEAPKNSPEETKEKLDVLNLPFKLQTKWIEKGKLYKKIGELRANLWSDEKAVRASAAQEIMKLTKENRKIWEQINYYQQYGVEMNLAEDHSANIDVTQLSTAELLTLSKNLPPWISKEKKKIAKEIDEETKKKRIIFLKLNETKFILVKHLLSKL